MKRFAADMQVRLAPASGSALRERSFYWIAYMVIACICVLCLLLVATRDHDIGKDTPAYAAFFQSIDRGQEANARIEPGFVFVTQAAAILDLGVAGYQGLLFGLLLGTCLLATRVFWEYLGRRRDYHIFLAASLALLLGSPAFVNAAVNAIRQGLASLLVFAALVLVFRGRWAKALLVGMLAASFHYSSVLYFLFTPVLLLSQRAQILVAVFAFSFYVTGLSEITIRSISPEIYFLVMDYQASAEYRSGSRLDFALFSMFWFALPFFVGRVLNQGVNVRIQESMRIYLVMLLPFFAVGFGNFSNRFLLPAWMSMSIILASMICDTRILQLRNAWTVYLSLFVGAGAFVYFVQHEVLI